MSLADQQAGDPRLRKIDYDINKIDYEWIERESNVKELKAGYDALEIDGCFPDLLRALGNKICEYDPKFKFRMESGRRPEMSAE